MLLRVEVRRKVDEDVAVGLDAFQDAPEEAIGQA
jgi:hypothetical protein